MNSPHTPPKVAVLGATGCVGREVCAAFARTGHEILAIARNHRPHVEGHTFIPLDVAAAEPAELAEVLTSERVGVVVNATGGWVLTQEAMEYAHVRLVDRVLAATARMAERPRVVQVGTIHEYGFVPEGVPIDERIAPNPTTPYAVTKHAGSEAVLAATRAGDVDGVVLRAVNVCGPHTTEASFLGAVMARLAVATEEEGIELTVADARRDYLDVRDLAEAVVKAAHAPAVGQVVNVGRGEAVSMRELVALLVAASGFPAHAVRERSAAVESKGGGWTRADISLAERLLGWRPRIDLARAMRDMWATRAVASHTPTVTRTRSTPAVP
ncbi:NAD-dependent epimerase/dehydratase family protein [Streptomyces kanamyceticus]|uniref:NAD(P)-dependent oxidoreductase n=1 Tax=Streptomyces kanamyceticus TaxID=1967 RepID=A0A5J6GPD5_STRKN|nr:NAD(P)-dependent oxidoreductase [Streptomyces kanamyceticus]QEU96282.1 NAD(P)-dependent oxidoreductase [Streptomyces kanamyceticus]